MPCGQQKWTSRFIALTPPTAEPPVDMLPAKTPTKPKAPPKKRKRPAPYPIEDEYEYDFEDDAEDTDYTDDDHDDNYEDEHRPSKKHKPVLKKKPKKQQPSPTIPPLPYPSQPQRKQIQKKPLEKEDDIDHQQQAVNQVVDLGRRFCRERNNNSKTLLLAKANKSDLNMFTFVARGILDGSLELEDSDKRAFAPFQSHLKEMCRKTSTYKKRREILMDTKLLRTLTQLMTQLST